MASSAATDTTFIPTPAEVAILKAWRQLPRQASAALLAVTVAILSDYGVLVHASTLEADPAGFSDPLGEDSETS
jgi:hypothetical protein